MAMKKKPLLATICLFQLFLSLSLAQGVLAEEVKVSVKQRVSSSSQDIRVSTETKTATNSADSMVRAQLKKDEIEKNIEKRREEIKKRIETYQDKAEQKRAAVKTKVASREAEMKVKLEANRKERLSKLFDLMVKRMTSAVTRIEKISMRMESRMEKLESEGKNVAEIKELLGTVDIKVGEITVDIEAAQKEFATLLDSETPGVAFEEMKKIVEEVYTDIKSVHETLRKIVEKMNALNPTNKDDN